MKNEDLLKRITVNPDLAHGKPIIRNLRYSVEFLLELLNSGMNAEEILADYEDLEAEDIKAVSIYDTRLSRVKRVQSIVS